LLAGLLFLIWRAQYGFCFNDEPFCVTLAQRMFQGDALIADEWHGVQNFGPVLLPFYALFRLFSPTNEGILLFLRYVYCVLWWSVCTGVFWVLRRRFRGAVFTFFYLVLFSPLDYMSMSYTSLGLMAVLLICCVLLGIPAEKERFGWGNVLVFSFLWVVLTLCSPFMAVGYVLLLLGALAGALFEKKRRSDSFFCRNLFQLGAKSVFPVAVCAVVYLAVFVFSRAELGRVLENFPYIFADPEHNAVSVVEAVLDLPYYIFKQFPVFIAVSALVFACGMVFPCKRYRIWLFGLCAALFFYGQAVYLRDIWGELNLQMLYVAILGAVAFALLEKKPYKLFIIFYGAGFGYAFFNNLTSNTQMMAISMSLSVAGAGGMVCIWALLREFLAQYHGRKVVQSVAFVLLIGVLTVQLSCELYTRLHRTYWDGALPELTQTISCGAARGLKTTAENAQAYQTQYQNLTWLLAQTETEGKRFLSCTSAPYLYLDADLEFAAFSAWSFGYDGWLDERILAYQQVNPERMPDLIYCDAEEDILPAVVEGYACICHDGAYLFVKQ